MSLGSGQHPKFKVMSQARASLKKVKSRGVPGGGWCQNNLNYTLQLGLGEIFGVYKNGFSNQIKFCQIKFSQNKVYLRQKKQRQEIYLFSICCNLSLFELEPRGQRFWAVFNLPLLSIEISFVYYVWIHKSINNGLLLKRSLHHSRFFIRWCPEGKGMVSEQLDWHILRTINSQMKENIQVYQSCGIILFINLIKMKI